MTDIEITEDATGEFMAFQAEGLTKAGTEFIDAFLPPVGVGMMHVVDAGRIVLPDALKSLFVKQCKAAGVTVA